MKTTRIKESEINHKWFVIDAENKILGRMSTRIAQILMGKNKVTYQPDIDNGDGVIIINAKKVRFTGAKFEDKMYYSHSGYIGNLKEKNLNEMMTKHPDRVILLSVKRMLPKNKLGRKMLTRLKVYSADKHPHESQKPVTLTV
ncbi:MAG: 50S ribosomal protein L13 [bacterium (Candidatus Stahlbacteria) CG23_combo_of_CG06-09_8_20_14_all_34_7]|nr:MAG: 50S ribosomal protein L13 [bacterium (Candidatus Stahlbacteria) CG23_combo_of_CG06-09_8_20_14_all_34_7]